MMKRNDIFICHFSIFPMLALLQLKGFMVKNSIVVCFSLNSKSKLKMCIRCPAFIYGEVV